VFTQKRGRAFLSRGRPFVAGWVGLDGILFFDERSERETQFSTKNVCGHFRFSEIYCLLTWQCLFHNKNRAGRPAAAAAAAAAHRRARARAGQPLRACVRACVRVTVHTAPPTHDGSGRGCPCAAV
jgi:hypothetical protein